MGSAEDTRRIADGRHRRRQSTVARYMTQRQGPRSQGWKTFLRNHSAGIVSLDLLVARTISFKLLYGLIILRHERRSGEQRVFEPCAERASGRDT